MTYVQALYLMAHGTMGEASQPSRHFTTSGRFLSSFVHLLPIAFTGPFH